MAVHARPVVAEDRLGHEGRGLAPLAGHVLDHVLVPHGVVGHGHQRAEHHGQFGLTGGGDLVVEDLDGDAKLFEGQRHLGANVHLRVDGGNREVAALEVRLVAEVAALFFGTAVPAAFLRIDLVERSVGALAETNRVEDEELGLGTEVRDVTDAGLLEVLLGLLGDLARVAVVRLMGDGVRDVGDERQRGFLDEGIDLGGCRVGDEGHVRLVDSLPAADGAAVEVEALGERVLLQLV